MDTIQIHIRAFGICQDIIGAKEFDFELDQPHDTHHLMDRLKATYPGIAALRSIALAVNEEYQVENQNIKLTDKFALIPPVAGG